MASTMYPPTFNILPSNYKKFLLQKYVNQAVTLGYICSSQQSPTSSSSSSRRGTRNWQHQQDEAPGVPLIAVIHRSAITAMIYVDE